MSLTGGYCVTKASVSCSPPDQLVQLDWAQLSWYHTDDYLRKVCLGFKCIKVIRVPPTELQNRWLQMQLAQHGAAPDSAHSFRHTQKYTYTNKLLHTHMHNSGMNTSAHLLVPKCKLHNTHTDSDKSTNTHNYKNIKHTLTAGTYAATHLQILTVAHIRLSN